MVLPNQGRSAATASSTRTSSHRVPKQKQSKLPAPQSDERRRPDPPERLAPSCPKLVSLPEKYSVQQTQGLTRSRTSSRRQEPTGVVRDEPRLERKRRKERHRGLARRGRTHKKEASRTADRQQRVEELDDFSQKFLCSHRTKSSSFVENPLQKMLQVYKDLRQKQLNLDDENTRVKSGNVSSLSGSSLGGESSGRKSLPINLNRSDDEKDEGIRSGPTPRDPKNILREARPCYRHGTTTTRARSAPGSTMQSVNINALQHATRDTDATFATKKGEHRSPPSTTVAVERGWKPRLSSLSDRPSRKYLKYLQLEVSSSRSFAVEKFRLKRRGGLLHVQNYQLEGTLTS